jgi:hypothetical protein
VPYRQPYSSTDSCAIVVPNVTANCNHHAHNDAHQHTNNLGHQHIHAHYYTHHNTHNHGHISSTDNGANRPPHSQSFCFANAVGRTNRGDDSVLHDSYSDNDNGPSTDHQMRQL